MQIQKFLLTSALYLSLGGSAVALADERDAESREGQAPGNSLVLCEKSPESVRPDVSPDTKKPG